MPKTREFTWNGMFADRAIPSSNGCLEFAGYKNEEGYGRIMRLGSSWWAHRLSYVLANGPIPEGMVVMHLCDNPSCVNPEHLKAGTVADNVHDMESKGRARKRKGSAHQNSKLTESDVIHIRTTNESVTNLAKRLGVTSTLVSRIRNGFTWKHVELNHAL
ncbi:HNH endonuclease signature motif containing protein [Pseudomonas sp.]|uniref:HNH endonuclease signature motif containing protein n=1 Tax=Pseudomonas sp. TaxID=306 RepID=UPI00390CBD8B